MSFCIYNSLSPACKTPFGAVKNNEQLTLTLRLPKSVEVVSVTLRLFWADCWDTPEQVEPFALTDSDRYQNSYTATFCVNRPGLYFYDFAIFNGQNTVIIRRSADGDAVLDHIDGGLWQLTVYDAQFTTSSFLKGGMAYQIFPDRFYGSGREKANVPADRRLHTDLHDLPDYLPDEQGEIKNNDYFGGDLAGIEEKLPYLKSLGVTCIYLNPIFEAHSNHRYNTADYLKIDPLLGDENDFSSLCAKAKEMGISIILDGVFSHTGSDSVYFNKEGRYGAHAGAYHDPDSPYRAWYKFTEYPKSYHSWWGFETLPEVIEENESYRRFICGENGVIQKWMRLGASGFRLDVADELPDIILDDIRHAVKAGNPDGCVLGEVWEDASNKISYSQRRRYFIGKQLDSVMNYPFRDAIIDYLVWGSWQKFSQTILSILENYPKPVVDVLLNSLSTHDTVRIITALDGESFTTQDRVWQAAHHKITPEQYQQGKRLFLLASVLQFTLPGIPCVYYGDEAGLTGYKDPFNRTFYPWGEEDTELVDFIAALGKLRTDNGVFAEGAFIPHVISGIQCSFIRKDNDAQIFVAINRTAQPIYLSLPAAFQNATPILGQSQLPDGLLSGLSFVIIKA